MKEGISAGKPKISVSEIREKLGPRFDRYSLADSAFLLMFDAIEEFPEDIRNTLTKKSRGESITDGEGDKFNRARSRFWERKFGVNFEGRFGDLGQDYVEPSLLSDTKVYSNKKEERLKRDKRKKLDFLNRLKMKKMLALRSEFKNLDEGEIVTEFADETRRVVYFDEDADKYYVLEGEQKRYLGVGDLLSDYAWGIKYVPDGEMIEPAYRRMAKRILANETRRELEGLYDEELRIKKGGISPELIKTPGKIERVIGSWEKTRQRTYLGLIAEIMARELLARLAQNKEIDIVVERVDVIEDGTYKYDFKVRVPNITRGVGVGDEEEVEKRIKKLGVQFTIAHHIGLKKFKFFKAKDEYKDSVPVDEIIFVQIKSSQFGEALNRWLKLGRPSGGPEQFLSEEIKSMLLEEITAGLSIKKLK